MHRLLAVLLVLAWFAGACNGGGDPGPTPIPTPADAAVYASPGPHGVGVTTIELVDTSRPTAPGGDFPGAPERRLQVEVWYPADAGSGEEEAREAAPEGGSYPLIVFAHGFGSFRRQSASYARHLASHGYLVASPDFPSTNLATPGGARLDGVLEQPDDVGFIIDSMKQLSEEPGNRFEGAFDGRVGVTGHSLGGLTTLLTVYGPLRDDRVMAAVAFSAPGCLVDDGVRGDVSVPIMHVGGSEDLIVDPLSIRAGYDASSAPRYFVELRGGDHLGFADLDIDDEDLVEDLSAGLLSRDRVIDPARRIAERIGVEAERCTGGGGPKGYEKMAKERQRELMRLFGALFFDAYLREDAGALALLRSDVLAAATADADIEFE